MYTSRAAELALLLSTNVAKVDHYNESNNIPPQSFAADAPLMYDYPEEIEEARQKVLDASYELYSLIGGPLQTFYGPPSHNHLLAPHLVYKHRLANSFPEGKDKATYEEIANNCGLSEPETRRIIRSAMTEYIFTEIEPGVVAHTLASKVLAENEAMQQSVGMISEELWPAAAHYVQATQKWHNSEEPNETGYQVANGTDKEIYEHMAEAGQGRSKRFAGAMSFLNSGNGFENEHLLANYDWKALGDATLVDVGGSQGPVAASVVARFPNITAIVEDRPEVIASASIPPGLEKRLSFRPHDFFEEQPVRADIYLFRWIFHNWSDKYSLKIIRALIPALKNGAKVLVHEYLVPEPGVVSKHKERFVRAFDLAMGAMTNAKEREVTDWTRLFTEADPRFKLTYVKQPPHSKLGILEFTFED